MVVLINYPKFLDVNVHTLEYYSIIHARIVLVSKVHAIERL